MSKKGFVICRFRDGGLAHAIPERNCLSILFVPNVPVSGHHTSWIHTGDHSTAGFSLALERWTPGRTNEYSDGA